MIKQTKHQGLPSCTLQGYVLHPPILSANQNNLQTGSLIVTEGHSDVFQGQPTDSVPPELSGRLQVWLTQHQAAQLAPYGMPVCAGATLAGLDIVLSTDCTCMEVCRDCDEESCADSGSLVLRMLCHTLGTCVVPLYSYPWLFPSKHYAVLELEEEHPLSNPQ